MSNNNLNETEISNIIHTLDLLGKQVKTGRIESDYALRLSSGMPIIGHRWIDCEYC